MRDHPATQKSAHTIAPFIEGLRSAAEPTSGKQIDGGSRGTVFSRAAGRMEIPLGILQELEQGPEPIDRLRERSGMEWNEFFHSIDELERLQFVEVKPVFGSQEEVRLTRAGMNALVIGQQQAR